MITEEEKKTGGEDEKDAKPEEPEEEEVDNETLELTSDEIGKFSEKCVFEL